MTPAQIRAALYRELPRHHKGFLCQYTADQVLAAYDRVIANGARCKACEARARKGFDGLCPCCSAERTRREMSDEREERALPRGREAGRDGE